MAQDTRKKWDNYFLSLLLNIGLLMLPFLITFFYKEPISERNLTMSTAMFVAGIVISLNRMPNSMYAVLILIIIFLMGIYGHVPQNKNIETVYNFQTLIIVFVIMTLGLDKYIYYIKEGNEFVIFNSERNGR
ncbi:hypothetical protein GR160_03060 [Flavobacterium sp. Sd200]|uniref:hypothetical protein n=1 Tax=Flavobacterium sp. Sd200 TaxID=2692211 RepID=UPI00136862A3|nr:hypothetical protein [Flavobacterium sp. Sd200]MXN90194.1 hypothetical protein [Flavobacterium sp. Sd200]